MENRKLVVDTSIFIEHLRARNKAKTTLYFLLSEQKEIHISVVTLFELYTGATNLEKWKDVETIVSGLTIVFLSAEIATESAIIFQELKQENKVIEFRDIFIGATARTLKMPVKTFNNKHFKRIKGIVLA